MSYRQSMTVRSKDIHGEHEKFQILLERIDLKDTDTLYILGDIFDRGPNPLLTMLQVLDMPNVHCLIGNHELMVLECMEFLLQKITDDSIKEFSVYEEISLSIAEWDMAEDLERSGWRILKSSMFREEGRMNKTEVMKDCVEGLSSES